LDRRVGIGFAPSAYQISALVGSSSSIIVSKFKADTVCCRDVACSRTKKIFPLNRFLAINAPTTVDRLIPRKYIVSRSRLTAFGTFLNSSLFSNSVLLLFMRECHRGMNDLNIH